MVKCTFLILVRKDGFFDTSFNLFKEKQFSSHSRVNVYFYEIKSPKWNQPLNIWENVFLQTGIDFIAPPKFHGAHLNVKSLVPSTQAYKHTGMYVICRRIRHSSRPEDVPNWHIQAGRRKGLQADLIVRVYADSDMWRYSRHDRQYIKRKG